jgi:hypothetical protein
MNSATLTHNTIGAVFVGGGSVAWLMPHAYSTPLPASSGWHLGETIKCVLLTLGDFECQFVHSGSQVTKIKPTASHSLDRCGSLVVWTGVLEVCIHDLLD